MISMVFAALLLMASTSYSQVPSPADSIYQKYYRKDYQYFNSPVADIRKHQNHMRIYTGPPVEFTRKKGNNRSWWDLERTPVIGRKDDEHRFWDVAFGGTFPIFGNNYNPDNFAWAKNNALDAKNDTLAAVRGWAMLIDAGSHMLLDFNANSDAVINTDFRIGVAFAGRSIPLLQKNYASLKHLSWRFRGFHECTHLGDEFVLDALNRNRLFDTSKVTPDTTAEADTSDYFQRYNVGYNPLELFLAWDSYEKRKENKEHDDYYYRLYGGARRLRDSIWGWGARREHERFLTYYDTANLEMAKRNTSLKTKDWEFQVGFEYFNRLARETGLKKWLSPNWYVQSTLGKIGELVGFKWENAYYEVLAADFYRRPRYDLSKAKMTWALNLVAGLVWRDYFALQKDPSSISLLLNYYNGPNPHGQFRNKDISYWGIDLSVGF